MKLRFLFLAYCPLLLLFFALTLLLLLLLFCAYKFINNYQKVGTPRPLWNATSQILMVVGYALIAIAMTGSLCIVSILVGICYRVRLAFTVPTASELFGLKCYALIYNILILNLSLSSFLFSDLLAGFLNDTEATATASGGNTCIGPHCYRLVNSDGVCVCDWVYVGCVVDGQNEGFMFENLANRKIKLVVVSGSRRWRVDGKVSR